MVFAVAGLKEKEESKSYILLALSISAEGGHKHGTFLYRTENL